MFRRLYTRTLWDYLLIRDPCFSIYALTRFFPVGMGVPNHHGVDIFQET